MPSKHISFRTRPPGHLATRPLVITIDGPAGVGKSTTAKLLAQRLGLLYLDTGATYRALAYAALKQRFNPIADARRLAMLAHHLPLQLRPLPDGGLRVLLDHADVTQAIRTEEVTEAAAQVSQHPDVRQAMVDLQRRLVEPPGDSPTRRGRHPERGTPGQGRGPSRGTDVQGVVVEGRDTGSVVFPHAPYKFFLDAAPVIRARRRQRELSRLYGSRPPLVQVQEQLHFRDGLDRSRRVGPLIRPKGAIVVNTSRLDAAQVVQRMLRHIRHSCGIGSIT